MKNSVWNKLTHEPEDKKQINTLFGLIIIGLVFVALVYIPFVLL